MVITRTPFVSPTYSSPEGARILVDAGASEAGSHEVGDWLRCPRWWALTHYGAFAGRAREPFVRGGLIHTGVAHHYIRWAIKLQGGIQYNGKWHTNAETFYTPAEGIRVLAHKIPAHEAKLAFDPDGDTGHSLMQTCINTVQNYILQARATDLFKIVAVETEYKIHFDAVPPGGVNAAGGLVGEEVPTPPQDQQPSQGTMDDMLALLNMDFSSLTGQVHQTPSEPSGMVIPSGKKPVRAFHTARVDLAVDEGAGGIWIEDHKGTRMPFPRALRMYRYSLQLLMLYNFGRQEYGERFKGVRVNLIEVPSGKSERHVIHAPCLANDSHALVRETREEMSVIHARCGSFVRAYPPRGIAGSCLDPVVGSLCEGHDFCSQGL